MARLRRRWRVLKWAGLVQSLLIMAAWAASGLAGVQVTWMSSIWWLCLYNGALLVEWESLPSPHIWSIMYREPYLLWAPWLVRVNGNERIIGVFLPLWIPFLLVAVPTAWLWWIDRHRIPPGHCQKCGYDLTGNVSSICPECGEKT
jgi:hypothetical protein